MKDLFEKKTTVKSEFGEGLHTVVIKDVQRYETEERVNAQNEVYVKPAHYDVYVENATCKGVIKISASEKATHEEKFIAFLLGIKEQNNIQIVDANELANYIIDNQIPFKMVKIPFEAIDHTGKLVTRYAYRTSAELIKALED